MTAKMTAQMTAKSSTGLKIGKNALFCQVFSFVAPKYSSAMHPIRPKQTLHSSAVHSEQTTYSCAVCQAPSAVRKSAHNSAVVPPEVVVSEISK
jgi:hypothetical protein